jgi:peptidoglycan/xylan/chitin deacetylase (PgdA/CDA1 family)
MGNRRGDAAGRRPLRHAGWSFFLSVAVFVAGCQSLYAPPQAPTSSIDGSSSSLDPNASPSTSGPPALPTPSPGPTFRVHIVRRGETLTAVARRYDTTPRSIAYWNRDTYPSLDPDSSTYQPNRIEIGWKLRLLPGQTIDEQNLPPTARPRPTAGRSQPPPPTPRPDGASSVVAYGTRGSDLVALTFDFGGSVAPNADIVRWLAEKGVRATVFMTGDGAATSAGREILAQVAAHPDLFGLGTQGLSYGDLTALDSASIAADLAAAEESLEGATGRTTRPFFRPPLGLHDAKVRDAVGRGNWSFTVMWDVDTLDDQDPATGGPSALDITTTVLSRVQGGSIIRFHLGSGETLAALPDIVAGIEGRGLVLSTLGELFGR